MSAGRDETMCIFQVRGSQWHENKTPEKWRPDRYEFTPGRPVTDEDILSEGQHAWDSALNTINVGKFNLGWASIGICTHAWLIDNDKTFLVCMRHHVFKVPHVR